MSERAADPGSPEYDELIDLAVAHATEGLAPELEERLQADAAASAAASAAVCDMELAAAAVQLALAPRREPPAGLAERLLAAALETPAAPAAPRSAAAERPVARAWPPLFALAGWTLAAAALALCVVLAGRLAGLRADGGVGEPGQLRDRLVAEAPDAFQLEWLEAFRHPRSGDLRGTVVWSDARNEGYMTFEGLLPNDPSQDQYQLWIFRGTDLDAEPHPVDGGVFDVAEDGRVVVAIDPKLKLDRAATFVVTLERPGGVVVSDRTAIVAVAQRAI